jgi:oligopeptide transport system substrate-binding protein
MAARTFLRTHFSRWVFALTAALLVGGCSNNPNPPEWSKEDTYFLAMGAEPANYDPQVSYTAGDAAVMDLIYPSYFRFNYLHQNPWKFELNLGIAEPVREPYSGKTHDKDGDHPFTGEKWTFELRHDLRYQDDACFPGGKGRAITAKDMEYAFKRLADPKLEFPLADNLSDKVIGWHEYSDAFKDAPAANYDKPFPGIQLDPTNPYKFTILLNQVYPQLRYIMAMHFTTPTPREAVEKYKDDFTIRHPVGCGPFKLEEYIPRDRVVLVQNPNHDYEKFPTDARPGTPANVLAGSGKKVPFVKRIVYRIISEVVTSFNLFDQGYLDSWGISPANAQIMLRSLRPDAAMTKRGVTTQSGAYPAIEYAVFNMEDPTFGGYTPDKRKLRQAISLGLDSDTYIALMSQGLGKHLDFMVPSGLGGYDPNYKNPYRQFDPKLTRAKELLAEAGYPGGISKKTGERLTINYDNYADSPTDRARERLITKQLKALGLAVVSRDTDYPTFDDKVKHKKVQFFTYGWVADYPDAENFCFLMYSDLVSPGPNCAVYKNPEYDKLFLQMRSMDDSPARDAIIHKMRDISNEDCAYIYLVENVAPTVYQPWVKYGLSNPILSDLAKYRDIDTEKRTRLQSEWNAPVLWPFILAVVILIVAAVPAVATVKRQRHRRVRAKASGGGQD